MDERCALRLNVSQTRSGPDLPLPTLLQPRTREGEARPDPLLAGVKVEGRFELAAAWRGETGEGARLELDSPRLLALEAEDGDTLFIRSDALLEAVRQVRSEAVVDGDIELARLRDPNAASRGVGEVLWQAVSVLSLPSDDVLAEARRQALAWARERLGEAITDAAIEFTSVLGAKALMWCIESALAGRPGLYRWERETLEATDYCPPDDEWLLAAARDKQPILVLIHGTGSYTRASFDPLRRDADTWAQLLACYPGGIYGFEHRTFSESPIENALALVQALPEGACVSLLTHSRGGLVGDLLCMDPLDADVIDSYRIDTSGAADPDGLRREAEAERQRLRTLQRLLDEKRIKIERYVRVACPARGTRLLSDNLEVALSDLLSLLQWGGSSLLGMVGAALGGPAAGTAVAEKASSALGVLKRLVLEIAGRRLDPRLVPGIAAMRTDAPLAELLGHPRVRRRERVEMAVIAGDTEFEGLGLTHLRRRIANLFCDWRLFDHYDNDLVVDTDAMFAGLAVRPAARYLYDQGAEVSHFRYFDNPLTREALRDWLTVPEVTKIEAFQPLGRDIVAWGARLPVQRSAQRRDLPVVILIPGIMGSHLEVGRKQGQRPGTGDRIWFDPPSLFLGKLDRLRYPDTTRVDAEDLFEMFYGDLAEALAKTHRVLRCPYDWRRPLKDCAQVLKAKVEEALRGSPGQPIRLLAHSMGGLVVRAWMQAHPDLWDRVVAGGGRLLMLGTPNQGSHLMVLSLLGKSDSLRMLEKLDARHGMEDILDIVAGMPGALALLPRPGFVDAASGDGVINSVEYYGEDCWIDLKKRNRDRFYGDGQGAVPKQLLLDQARQGWQELSTTVRHPERIAYVYGHSRKTPCGVARTAEGRLQMLYTADGDGSVTWAAGRLDGLGEDRYWYMPVEHADLADTERYFPAIVDLLSQGSTGELGRLPRRRGEPAPVFAMEAAPPVLPEPEELARAMLGSGPRRCAPARERPLLRVAVQAGDLRFVDRPVLCGHYLGDAITGAEAALDEMLGHALSQRQRLGVYAGELGTSSIVLQPPNAEQRRRGSLPGAVIVGLGAFTGQLSSRQVSETVRAGVLRYLLHLQDLTDAFGMSEPERVPLYSLLLGWNSNYSLSVPESVAATTLGVLRANRQFQEARGKGRTLAVTDLVFIELYLDAAITAGHAVAALPQTLSTNLKRLGMRLEPADSLHEGEGVRARLSTVMDTGHWSRLIITHADGADRPDNAARPADAEEAAQDAATCRPPRLKYVLLSQRARAESIMLQRQPELLESIIRTQWRNPASDPKLGHFLFHLLVPLEFKAASREQARLLLVLDDHTAGLPWELLQIDDEPLVLRAPVIRQLASPRFRPVVRVCNTNTACIIANPSTEGYDRRFPGGIKSLDDLAGAEQEGREIENTLRQAGWTDITRVPGGTQALEVLHALYARPYRILAISAHGLFETRGLDGCLYTGAVLSDGLLITAAEIAQMEAVPDLVFLNCCHLGRVNDPLSQPSRLAYSLARELIEMGVRCVLAAGWAVDDAAACTFAAVFFESLVRGANFGEAVAAARRVTYEKHTGTNSWGAYQAWGDPSYRLQTAPEGESDREERRYVAPDELIAAVQRQRLAYRRRCGPRRPDLQEAENWLRRQLDRCPAGWGEHPAVAQAIAALYADFCPEGFAEARRRYERAIQREDRAGRVAVQAIEQLANLEAREGGRLVAAGRAEEGLVLIDRAIQRMQALRMAVQGDGTGEINVERAGILGSAHRLRALAQAVRLRPWEEIAQSLKEAAQAYAAALPGDPATAPYPALNVIQLDWLAGAAAGGEAQAIMRAQRCGEAARQRYRHSLSFWDAVMSVDAELTVWLLGGPLGEGAQAVTAAEAVDWLAGRYAQAVADLPQSAREWDSVAQQWCLLALLLERRDAPDDGGRAQALRALAARFARACPEAAGGEAEPPQPAPQTGPPPAPAARSRTTRHKRKG